MGATAGLGIATGLKVGSSIGGAYSKSKAQEQAGEFEARRLERNSRLQAFKAVDAVTRGEKAVVKSQQATKGFIGKQRVALAAQGIDIESGSALQIQEETAAIGAEEALNIRNNAWREAWGYRANEADLVTQARFAKITSKYDARNTILTGGIQAITDVSSAYYTYQKDFGSSKITKPTQTNPNPTPDTDIYSGFQYNLSGSPLYPRRRP